MAGRHGTPKPPGEIRQSQLLTSYGPGALVDLPDHAVIMGGLESWTGPRRPIFEERLQAKLAKALEVKSIALYSPPVAEQADGTATGVKAWRFPEWFVAQFERSLGENKEVRSRPLVPARRLVKGKYFSADKTTHNIVPVRFVQACPKGHVSDIDWQAFAHSYEGNCRRNLWLDEHGTSGEFTEIFVRCECGKSRSLALTAPTKDRPAPLGMCKGHRPWLGKGAREECKTDEGKGTPNRLLTRSASNAYFSQTVSVIHIPEKDSDLRKAVDLVWTEHLSTVEEPAELKFALKNQKVSAAVGSFPAARVFAEIQRRNSGIPAPAKKIKEAELETLLTQPEEFSEDVPAWDFYAVTLPNKPDTGAMSKVENVVLVHRLLEVVAQVGFTRFDSSSTDIDGELRMDVHRAALSMDSNWLPAVENRGEGIFISLKMSAVSAWLKRLGVKKRLTQLADGHAAWLKAHPKEKAAFPGPYVMLHSLSHMLITSVALECGYSASSIRERVYFGAAGAGILLYTASSDAEGTLGGLVEVGRNIGDHLERALEIARLCSNDPVCAQHQPDNKHAERFLHGASCHGCLLIAEPSCERQNTYLDRALVVPTVDTADAAFFADEE